MTHTTTPWQDLKTGIEGLAAVLIGLALLIGIPIGILCLIQSGMDNYKSTKEQNAWVRAHAVRVLEIKGTDTTVICDDNVKYHLTPYLGGK